MSRLTISFSEGPPIIPMDVGISPIRLKFLAEQGQQAPPIIKAKGLLDLATDGLALDYDLVQLLGLPCRGWIRTDAVQGSWRYAQLFELGFKINFPDDIGVLLHGQCVGLMGLSRLGIDALIGRNIMSHFVVNVDGPKRIVTIDYDPATNSISPS